MHHLDKHDPFKDNIGFLVGITAATLILATIIVLVTT